MEFIAILILFPFVCAAILGCVGNDKVRKALVYLFVPIIMGVAVFFSVKFFVDGGKSLEYLVDTKIIDTVMLVAEFLIMALVCFLSFKYKKYYAALLSVAQTGLLAWLELSGKVEMFEATTHIFVDRFSIVMILMIALIGGFICIYTVGYLKAYHNHHTDYKNRTRFFVSMIFIFLGAMFGLVVSNNLIWMYFFWEITSVLSFLLIGYTKTEEAVNNSFKALWMNLLGGLGFAIAIVYSVLNFNILNLQSLVANGNGTLLAVPVMLLAFAGLTKSAQLPFSRWLLGAMVAPTPSSALLHSATMVKAGIYMLIRLAPLMCGTSVGTTVAIIGGLTFFVASVRAIVHSDGKKVLAYSTISNLGLMTACAGIGTEATVWAGVFLMIFHGVSKSLLFQTVGAIENATGSRDIEDMHGLIKRYPFYAFLLIIGIFGMFLAPFGMLVSKWAAIKAFIDAGNIFLVITLAFGSATTLFYWAKWLTKIIAFPGETKEHKCTTSKDQCTSLVGHAVLMISLALAFPIVATTFMKPLLKGMFGTTTMVLGTTDLIIMSALVIAMFVVPVVAWLATRKSKVDTTMSYMSGINDGTGRRFTDSFGEKKEMYLANWYMRDFFKGKKFLKPATIIAVAVLVVGMIISIGGAL